MAVPGLVRFASTVTVGAEVAPPNSVVVSLARPKSKTGLTFRRDEDICRLDVAMDDAFGVGGVESAGELHAEIEDGFDVEGLFRDQMLEGVALEKFHGDECAIFTLVDVVDGANVGVVESGGGASLATETFERLRIVSDVVGQEFQGDKAA